MADLVVARPVDAVYTRLDCESGIMAELYDYFSFDVPGAKFMPLYRSGRWDGMVHLVKRAKRLIHSGLLPRVEEFCRVREYEFQRLPVEYDPVAPARWDDLPPQFEVRDYQVEAVERGLADRRVLFLSPTSSGKSLMIYQLIRALGGKTLVVVPTTGLVAQMHDDFVSYGCDPRDINTIQAGSKDSERRIVVSTWQSIKDHPVDWFSRFESVMGDEAHLYTAESLTGIMEKLRDCHNRFGFTGTLNGSRTHQWILEGLFGPVMRVTTTKELMDRGYVARLEIKALTLVHPDAVRRSAGRQIKDYQSEIEYLVGCEARNRFLRDLVLSLRGNTLVLFHRIEGHGEVLRGMIEADCGSRPVHFIHGGVKGSDRNASRALVEAQDDAIVLASFGTTSTGVSIKRLHNVVFAHPWKSPIVNLQSIGRGLRMGSDKTECVLYDISDDLSWKSRQNHTLRHFTQRVGIYAEQQFSYRMFRVPLEY